MTRSESTRLNSTPGIALQLYTVRDLAKTDFRGTLARVREIGYPAVQLAGYGGLAAAALKRHLDDLGLAVAGSHIAWDRLATALDEEISINREVDNLDIVCPVLPSAYRADEAGYQAAAVELNRWGRRCRDAGARLSYHNHAFEFEPIGARSGMAILLSETDPSLVAWEPDVYWIAFAGEDPATWIKRYAARCPLIHLKDMTPAPERTFAEVGEGTLDFEPVFRAASAAEWYIVEQDTCARPPLESAAISFRNLRDWGK